MVSAFDWTQVSQAAYAAVLNGEPRTVIKILTRNLKQIKKMKSRHHHAWTCYTLANAYINVARHDDAVPLLREAVRLYRKVDAKKAGDVYSWLGWTLEYRKRYLLAARVFIAAAEFEKESTTPNFDTVVDCYIKAGDCKWRSHQFAQALDLFRQAYRIGTRYDVSPPHLAKLCSTLRRAYETAYPGAPLDQIRSLSKSVRRRINATISQLPAVKTKRGKLSNNYFGVVLKDPYRWLEETGSEAVRQWIGEQNQRSSNYLNSLSSRYSLLAKSYTFYQEEICLPQVNGRSLYFHKGGSHGKLLRSSAVNAQQKLILDVSKWGDHDLLSGWWTSPNGRYLVFGRAVSGSDWVHLHVRNLRTKSGGEYQSMPIMRYPSLFWLENSKGFFYSGYVKDRQRYQIRYHSPGANGGKDRVIYEHKHSGEDLHLISVHGKYLLLGLRKGHINLLVLMKKTGKAMPKPVLKARHSHFQYAAAERGKVYFLTNHLAKRNRLISTEVAPDKVGATAREKVIVKEEVPDNEDVLLKIYKCRRTLVCIYGSVQEPGNFIIKRVRNGRFLPDVTRLPPNTFIADASLIDYPTLWFKVEGVTMLPNIYKYDVETGRLRKSQHRKRLEGKTDFYETTLIWATSRDGTRIPIYVSFKKGLKLNGNNPTLLNAYGGFNVATKLFYSSLTMSWLEAGGILAHAVIRGGGEFGRAWREEGRGPNKQNCFDDFIAAAQKLISAKITRADKLGMYGGSNGGLLVGGVLAQRPDLFGACVISCALLDMLRYHLFHTARFWLHEYGIARRKNDFQILRSYSPLHNLRPARYPATLIYTGGDDDRVSPAHSYKFAARLQSVQRGDAPILLKVEEKSGHGLRHNSSYWTDMLSFFAHHLGLRTEAF